MNGPVDIVVNGVAVPICAQLWPSLAAASLALLDRVVGVHFLAPESILILMKGPIDIVVREPSQITFHLGVGRWSEKC